MLTIKNIEVSNFENALRGMRNPLESWNKQDSHEFVYTNACHPASLSFDEKQYHVLKTMGADALCINIGPNDLALAQKLIRAGTDHSKFMRQIFVSMDITAPLYW